MSVKLMQGCVIFFILGGVGGGWLSCCKKKISNKKTNLDSPGLGQFENGPPCWCVFKITFILFDFETICLKEDLLGGGGRGGGILISGPSRIFKKDF